MSGGNKKNSVHIVVDSKTEIANRAETLQCQTATKEIQLGQSYSYLYDEESLVSSNLNSKLFRFHCVRPSLVYTTDSINSKLNGDFYH